MLFSDVWVGEQSQIEDSLVLPHVRIGKGCRIRRAIIDAGCSIADGTVIGETPEADAQHYEVSRGGVVLVTREALGQRQRVSRYAR